ncbi:MAG TPA: septal ring lytic transglycosylase RlpA family protein [Thermoanaerobaculia bacterium]|nr:septal ring lytic transglycosylase RlpA family protein [Thermoanaerobaculia bacterium]
MNVEGRGLRAEGNAATRILVCSVLVVLAYGCATTAPPQRKDMEPLRGVASWYGEEFSGRTTANGEIFDPTQLTAAHRTLPFGTILDVTNALTGQTVRVRVNDRGPYIGGRLIDLSYAAAQKISLVEPGIGEVDIKVIRIGSGDREAPQPFGVTVAEAPKSVPVIPSQQQPPPAPATPKVDFPLPAQTAPAAPVAETKPEPVTPLPAVTPVAPAPVAAEPAVTEEPVVVDRVAVETQRGDVITRKQVSADGKRIEEVEVGEAPPRTTATRAPAPAPRTTATTTRRGGTQFVVQVGAFSIESNAKALQERLTSIGQRAYIDKTSLWRVRIGPFPTRDQAVAARNALEGKGISGIVVTE